jgi:hypothetical protein
VWTNAPSPVLSSYTLAKVYLSTSETGWPTAQAMGRWGTHGVSKEQLVSILLANSILGADGLVQRPLLIAAWLSSIPLDS